MITHLCVPTNSTTTTSDRDLFPRSLQKPSPVATLASATAQSQNSQKLAKPDKARKRLADLVKPKNSQTHQARIHTNWFTDTRSCKLTRDPQGFANSPNSKAQKLAKARKVK